MLARDCGRGSAPNRGSDVTDDESSVRLSKAKTWGVCCLCRAHAKPPQLRPQEKPRTSLRSGRNLPLLPGPVQAILSLNVLWICVRTWNRRRVFAGGVGRVWWAWRGVERAARRRVFVRWRVGDGAEVPIAARGVGPTASVMSLVQTLKAPASRRRAWISRVVGANRTGEPRRGRGRSASPGAALAKPLSLRR